MKKTILLLLLQCCALLSVPARAGNENGSAGDMPAYYDHQLLTINFMELPSGRDSAAGLTTRRLGIEVWQTDSWTKPIIACKQPCVLDLSFCCGSLAPFCQALLQLPKTSPMVRIFLSPG